MLKLAFTSFITFLSCISFAQTAGFTFQANGGLLCSPVSINFTNTSTGNPTGFIWNFGNGQISNQAAPSVQYNSPGTYNVKLVAVFNGSVAESVQTITINPGITATITADRNYICQPGAINFTASSTGNISTYNWDFGDGAAMVTTSNANVSHNYTALGNYTVKLIATDVSGCIATANYDVRVQKIAITGSVSPTYGCIPVIANFTAAATIPSGSTVVSYTWDFGDGTPTTQTLTGNNAHSYTSTGTFFPKVTIVTSEGCSNSYDFQTVGFGTPPTGTTASPNKIVYCGSETPVFTASAVNADAYGWDFGDGTFITSSIIPITHKYATLGPKTVYVTPYFNGCPGPSASFNITIVGVIAGYNYTNTCIQKTTFQFINTSQGVISNYLWNFGDGSPTSSSQNSSHLFANNGSFSTSLIVRDSTTGCADTTSALIHSGKSTLVNADTSICRTAVTTFSILNNQLPTTAVYSWNVVGTVISPVNARDLATRANIFGDFTSNFVSIDNGPEYCPDTAYLDHPIRVRGPQLDFTGPASLCAGSSFSVSNKSKAYYATDSVGLWYWNFDLSSNNDTIYQPPAQVYSYPGTFTVKLVAKDTKGCVDSLTKTLIVNPSPFVQVLAKKNIFCQGQSDSLIAYHSDSLLWSPAAAVPCTNCDTIVVNPNANTQYIAEARNSFGCVARDTTAITVFAPFTATALGNSAFICRNDTTTISVAPAGKMVTWSPSAGLSSSTVYRPIASPQVTTLYTATLKDSVGCFTSSATVSVVVKSLPTVDAGPDRILPYNSTFTINPTYSSNARNYTWSPSTNLNCANCANPAGVALKEELYVVRVVSDSGCVASDSIKISIECKYANLLLPSAFTPNNDSRNDVYYPIARGIRTIKRFVIFNRMGQKMFEAKDFEPNNRSSGWNGDYRGQKADPGAYVYMLEAVCETGSIITKKDSFILLR